MASIAGARRGGRNARGGLQQEHLAEGQAELEGAKARVKVMRGKGGVANAGVRGATGGPEALHGAGGEGGHGEGMEGGLGRGGRFSGGGGGGRKAETTARIFELGRRRSEKGKQRLRRSARAYCTVLSGN